MTKFEKSLTESLIYSNPVTTLIAQCWTPIKVLINLIINLSVWLLDIVLKLFKKIFSSIFSFLSEKYEKTQIIHKWILYSLIVIVMSFWIFCIIAVLCD